MIVNPMTVEDLANLRRKALSQGAEANVFEIYVKGADKFFHSCASAIPSEDVYQKIAKLDIHHDILTHWSIFENDMDTEKFAKYIFVPQLKRYGQSIGRLLAWKSFISIAAFTTRLPVDFADRNAINNRSEALETILRYAKQILNQFTYEEIAKSIIRTSSTSALNNSLLLVNEEIQRFARSIISFSECYPVISSNIPEIQRDIVVEWIVKTLFSPEFRITVLDVTNDFN